MECEGASPGGQTHEQPLEKDPSSQLLGKKSFNNTSQIAQHFFFFTVYICSLNARQISDGFQTINISIMQWNRKKNMKKVQRRAEIVKLPRF